MYTTTPSIVFRVSSRMVIFWLRFNRPLRNAGGKSSREIIFKRSLCFSRITMNTLRWPVLSVRWSDFADVFDDVAIIRNQLIKPPSSQEKEQCFSKRKKTSCLSRWAMKNEFKSFIKIDSSIAYRWRQCYRLDAYGANARSFRSLCFVDVSSTWEDVFFVRSFSTVVLDLCFAFNVRRFQNDRTAWRHEGTIVQKERESQKSAQEIFFEHTRRLRGFIGTDGDRQFSGRLIICIQMWLSSLLSKTFEERREL